MTANGEAVRGLSNSPVSALRYNSHDWNPHESSGLLMSMIPARSRVLDIGCGTGSISVMIRDRCGATVVGVEPHPERAQKARSQGLDVVTGIYTDEVRQKYGTFDVIVFADVLEHLVDPVQTLDDIKPALAPGGRVLASIPNVAHWTVRLALLFGRFDYQPSGLMDATHLRWFTRKGVHRLFDDTGYDIDQFHAATGAWLDAYRWTPLRPFSDWRRSVVLSKLCAVAPGLMGVQHVVSAKLRAES